jgi:hypothetical protein
MIRIETGALRVWMASTDEARIAGFAQLLARSAKDREVHVFQVRPDGSNVEIRVAAPVPVEPSALGR